MTDNLVKRLWESDEASTLTNQAARRIEALTAENTALEVALRDAVLQIEYLHEMGPVTGSGNAVLASARAILAKVEGKSWT